jgi:hypothetical protein
MNPPVNIPPTAPFSLDSAIFIPWPYFSPSSARCSALAEFCMLRDALVAIDAYLDRSAPSSSKEPVAAVIPEAKNAPVPVKADATSTSPTRIPSIISIVCFFFCLLLHLVRVTELCSDPINIEANLNEEILGGFRHGVMRMINHGNKVEPKKRSTFFLF